MCTEFTYKCMVMANPMYVCESMCVCLDHISIPFQHQRPNIWLALLVAEAICYLEHYSISTTASAPQPQHSSPVLRPDHFTVLVPQPQHHSLSTPVPSITQITLQSWHHSLSTTASALQSRPLPRPLYSFNTTASAPQTQHYSLSTTASALHSRPSPRSLYSCGTAIVTLMSALPSSSYLNIQMLLVEALADCLDRSCECFLRACKC